MKNKKLEKSYQLAIEIMQDHSKSFYHAFSQLPEERFLAVASVYAFCRTADDLADDQINKSKEEIEKELDLLKSLVHDLEKKDQVKPDIGWWPAFSKTVVDYDIPSKAFLMQIRGQKRDLEDRDIENLNELIDYSRDVAGSVGRMLLPILIENEDERKNEEILEACENLGIAMQITNILRDVGEDLKLRNRVYLPKTLLEEYGLDKDKLKELIEEPKGRNYDSFVSLWENLADLSKDYYRSFTPYLCKFDKSVRLPVFASAKIYAAIMDEVRQNDYNCLNYRNYTSRHRRARILDRTRRQVESMCE